MFAHSTHPLQQVLWLPSDSDGAWLKRDNGMYCTQRRFQPEFFVFNAALIAGTPQSASTMLNSMR
jgi:hypothetical protein